MSSSEEYWEERASDLSRTSLDTIRASATAWAATTAALFGIFGTVGLLVAPDSIDKLADPGKAIVTGLVIVAALAAVASIVATSSATRGPTRKFTPLTGLRLATWTRTTAVKAQRALFIGRVTGLLAAVLLLTAGVVGTIAGATASTTPPATSYLVRTAGGTVQCGLLKRTGAGLILVDSDGKQLLDLGTGIADVVSVASCPGAPGT